MQISEEQKHILENEFRMAIGRGYVKDEPWQEERERVEQRRSFLQQRLGLPRRLPDGLVYVPTGRSVQLAREWHELEDAGVKGKGLELLEMATCEETKVSPSLRRRMRV